MAEVLNVIMYWKYLFFFFFFFEGKSDEQKKREKDEADKSTLQFYFTLYLQKNGLERKLLQDERYYYFFTFFFMAFKLSLIFSEILNQLNRLPNKNAQKNRRVSWRT